MKKKIFVALLTAAVMTLCSCNTVNNDNEKEKKTSKSKPEETQQADYIVNIDDSFDSGLDLSDVRETLSPEEADFRNLKWGMTKEEVSKAQGTGYREPKNNVMYYTRVREEGFPADAEYTFVDEKLAQGIFYITQNKSDEPVKIEDYSELVESLKARFGEPQIADAVFVSEEDKTEDSEKQTELIKQGKLQLRTGWILDDTELRVVMFPNGGELCIGLQYKQAGVEIPTE